MGPGALLSNEALLFHEKCGALIKLSNGHKTAERRRPLDEFNNGVVLTNRPLRDGEMFEVWGFCGGLGGHHGGFWGIIGILGGHEGDLGGPGWCRGGIRGVLGGCGGSWGALYGAWLASSEFLGHWGGLWGIWGSWGGLGMFWGCCEVAEGHHSGPGGAYGGHGGLRSITGVLRAVMWGSWVVVWGLTGVPGAL